MSIGRPGAFVTLSALLELLARTSVSDSDKMFVPAPLATGSLYDAKRGVVAMNNLLDQWQAIADNAPVGWQAVFSRDEVTVIALYSILSNDVVELVVKSYCDGKRTRDEAIAILGAYPAEFDALVQGYGYEIAKPI